MSTFAHKKKHEYTYSLGHLLSKFSSVKVVLYCYDFE